jgi:hypothetical protein
MSDPVLELKRDSLLGRPQDIIHFAERVNLWWAVYMLDRRVAMASGLPPGLWDQARKV